VFATGDTDEELDEQLLCSDGSQRIDNANGINRAEYSQLIVWEVYS